MSVGGRAAYFCASHDGVFLEIVGNGRLPREFRTMEKVHMAARLGVGADSSAPHTESAFKRFHQICDAQASFQPDQRCFWKVSSVSMDSST